MQERTCRFCNTLLEDTFVDLGMSPLSNSFISSAQLNAKESFYPLHAYVCPKCFLVQLEEFESPEAIFSDYAYFSSYSDSWLEHASQYTKMMLNRFPITSESLVVEVASNDGYLLQYFKEQHVKVLGIEPATNVAKEAEKKGISTINEFFGTKMAQKLVKEEIKADVLLGNNVIAHVPDINDFVAGMKILLKGHGVITMEFPHLLRLMEQRQFDTIYHEHFSYLSFGTIRNIFATHGLRLFDVDELPTHGGSLRIYACHDTFSGHDTTKKVEQLLQKETVAGLKDINVYRSFTKKVQAVKLELLEALIALKKQGHSIVAYGAPAKGNTILNYCGIRTDLIEYTVDRSPHKQGKFLPGTHIPIFAPDKIKETRPDYVVILPWNLKQEIIEQMKYIRSWGGRFIVAIPKLEVL